MHLDRNLKRCNHKQLVRLSRPSALYLYPKPRLVAVLNLDLPPVEPFSTLT